MKDLCYGCRGSCGPSSVIHIGVDGKPIVCPCAECVIKVICTQGCDRFSEFVEMVDGDFYGE